MKPMPSPSAKQPNCLGCRHFYITHEPKHPYGCKALGFKALQYPAMVVFASSGLHCQLFLTKKTQVSSQLP